MIERPPSLGANQARTCGLLYACAALATVVACGGGEQTIIDPPPVASSGFTLSVRADPADASVTAELGWATGVPGAVVVISPVDSSAPPRSLVTGATGEVTIPDLPAGKYFVSARRVFTNLELQALAQVTDAAGFAGEGGIDVSPTLTVGSIQIPASRRRSLLISEWSFNSRNIPGSGTYHFGGYLELYNNSDSTIYLDGVLIAHAWSQLGDWPGYPCVTSEPFRNDPAGLWAQKIATFPGSGRDFPLMPGDNVVVATDAVDHRDLFPGMIDLRDADFEFLGSADVDNPAVPNMLDVSTEAPPFGHGLIFPASFEVVVGVAEAADARSLLRRTSPRGEDYLRLPSAGLLDVFASATTYLLTLTPPRAFCSEMLPPSIDRMHGFFFNEDSNEWQVSVSRKALTQAPNGQVILQNTRTSANDYYRTPRTPGVVK